MAKHAAVLLDYNEHRSLTTDIAEWLEGGDYFNFIVSIRNELPGISAISGSSIPASVQPSIFVKQINDPFPIR